MIPKSPCAQPSAGPMPVTGSGAALRDGPQPRAAVLQVNVARPPPCVIAMSATHDGPCIRAEADQARCDQHAFPDPRGEVPIPCGGAKPDGVVQPVAVPIACPNRVQGRVAPGPVLVAVRRAPDPAAVVVQVELPADRPVGCCPGC